MAGDLVPARDYAPDQTQIADAADVSSELARKRRWFRAFEANKRREQDEAQEARRYYHGKQWTDDEIKTLKARKQPVITSNRIKRKVDFLIGISQRLRRDPKGYPRNPSDEQSAYVATAALRFACEINRWEQLEAEANAKGLVSGVGAVFIGIESDPMGAMEVRMKTVPEDRFFYDPRSVEPDFSDARYLGLHLWLDIDDAVGQFPQYEKELSELLDMASAGDTALKAEDDRSEQWADFEGQRVRIVEFWEKKPSPVMPSIMGWYYCKFCGDIQLEAGWSPYKDEKGKPDCPYLAWSPYVDEKGDRYGVVRDMRSIQDEVNHRRSKFLHLLNVRQVYMREGVVEDEDDLRRQLARPDGIIKINGEWGADVGIIDQTKELQGQAELLTEAKAELENLGPNPGLIGKGGGIADQSGRAILAQRDSGMTELSPVFERFRDWKLRCYRMIWNRIRQAWTAEKWIRVTESDQSVQFVPINSPTIDPQTGMLTMQNAVGQIDVDIILDEGPDSLTMQEEEFEMMTQMVQAGLPIPPDAIIKASSLRNKDEILQAMQAAMQPPPPQEDPRAAEAYEIEKQGAIADVDKKRADADLTRAKIAESAASAQQRIVQMQSGVVAPPA